MAVSFAIKTIGLLFQNIGFIVKFSYRPVKTYCFQYAFTERQIDRAQARGKGTRTRAGVCVRLPQIFEYPESACF